MFAITLQRAQHLRRYSIQSVNHVGWEVALQEDQTLKHHVRYDDWHRVERALAMFTREVSELRDAGWIVQVGSLK